MNFSCPFKITYVLYKFSQYTAPEGKQSCKNVLITMTWDTDYHIYIYDFVFTFGPSVNESNKLKSLCSFVWNTAVSDYFENFEFLPGPFRPKLVFSS